MKFPNLHLVRTEGKNFSHPDMLSRSFTTTTKDEHRLRAVEFHDSIKLFMTHNQQTQPIQCHDAVSEEYIKKVTTDTTVESTHFPISLQIKDKCFKVQSENKLYLLINHITIIKQRQSL